MMQCNTLTGPFAMQDQEPKAPAAAPTVSQYRLRGQQAEAAAEAPGLDDGLKMAMLY